MIERCKKQTKMVRTWIADIGALTDKDVYQQYYMEAPDFRKIKADKMQTEHGKMQSIGVWSLYEKVCREYNISKDAVYNFSHSGDYVLCTAADREDQSILAGCDLEEMKKLRMKVARRFFCEAEYQWIKSKPQEEERRQEFYRYWVLKESFMKAVCLGMKLPMNTYEIQIGTDGTPVLIRQPEDIKGVFYFQEYQLAKEGRPVPYKIAVCTTDEEICPELTEVIL